MNELLETARFKTLEVVHKMQTLEFLHRLRKDKRGVTAMEYGLIAALIGVAAVAAMRTLGTDIGNRFNNVAATIRTP